MSDLVREIETRAKHLRNRMKWCDCDDQGECSECARDLREIDLYDRAHDALRWRSVEDELPEEGVYVYVKRDCRSDHPLSRNMILKYVKDFDFGDRTGDAWCQSSGFRDSCAYLHVTHWRPIE